MRTVQVPRRFTRSEWGGTETVVLETSRRLNDLGHHTTVVCPNALCRDADEPFDRVPVVRLPYFYPYLGLKSEQKRQLDFKGGNMFSFELLRSLMHETDFDLLHLHTGKRIGGIGRRAALARDVPYVVSLHGGLFDVPTAEAAELARPTEGAFEWGKALGWWVGSRRVLEDAAAIICVSRRECERVGAALPRARPEYLPNGVDINRFAYGDGEGFRQKHGIDERIPVILTVGRIDPQKNQLHALDLLRSLTTLGSHAHLVLIGHVTDHEYFARMKRRVGELDLHGRVTIIPGLAPDDPTLIDAYHASDIFLLPSVHEPFGIVALEAWAAGLPVVASRVGGLGDLITCGSDGLLFDLDRGSRGLGELRCLVDASALRLGLGENGRRRVLRSFDWSRVTERLLRLYESVLREHETPRLRLADRIAV